MQPRGVPAASRRAYVEMLRAAWGEFHDRNSRLAAPRCARAWLQVGAHHFLRGIDARLLTWHCFPLFLFPPERENPCTYLPLRQGECL